MQFDFLANRPPFQFQTGGQAASVSFSIGRKKCSGSDAIVYYQWRAPLNGYICLLVGGECTCECALHALWGRLMTSRKRRVDSKRALNRNMQSIVYWNKLDKQALDLTVAISGGHDVLFRECLSATSLL